MPFKLVIPAVRSSATIGARSAAVRLARADRAMSAVFGARWPKWRPVGMALVCQGYLNGPQTPASSHASACPLASRTTWPPGILSACQGVGNRRGEAGMVAASRERKAPVVGSGGFRPRMLGAESLGSPTSPPHQPIRAETDRKNRQPGAQSPTWSPIWRARCLQPLMVLRFASTAASRLRSARS
jgi:hypothetical protein